MTAEPVGADAPLGVAPESVGRFLARAVPLVVIGALLGGLIGAAAAAVGVATTFRRSATLVTVGAIAMLVVAALATVIEVPVDETSLRSSYALDRPVASAAGLVAALFALVAVVTLAARERPSQPLATAEASAPAGEPSDAADDPDLDAPAEGAIVRARRAAPMVAVLGAIGVTLLLVAPAPPAATREVAESARLGVGWGRETDAGLIVDGTEPPLAVAVDAAAPGGEALWTAAAGTAAAGLVALLVRRRRSHRAALLAAALVGAGLVLTRADLAATLVAATLAGVALLADPLDRTSMRAATAGALFGLTVLASPALALALPVLVLVLVVGPDRETTVAHGLAGLTAAVVVIAPWQRWVLERFSTWLPAAELHLPPGTLASVVVLAGAVAVAHQRRLPGLS